MLRDALHKDGSRQRWKPRRGPLPYSLGLTGMEYPALSLDVKQGIVILTKGH